MKEASPELKAWLISTPNMVRPSLYTITLSGGQVLRWTDADIPVRAMGHTFQPVAGLSDGGTKSRRGVVVSTMEVTLQADDRHTINGLPVIEFITGRGLDGALVTVHRAFATDWDELHQSGPVGVIIRFSGRFTEIIDAGRTEATINLSDWLELLNTNLPTDMYQASCLNSLFDERCGVDPEDHTASGTISAGAHTENTFATSLATTAGTYNNGTIMFTSGPNEGLLRTIRSQDVSGNLVIVLPLPAPPEPGDTFVARPGCNRSMGSQGCGRFNNLLRFRGQPFVPNPEMAI